MNEGLEQRTANGGGYQHNPQRAGAGSGSAARSLVRSLDSFLESGARWSPEVVKPAFDYGILNAASSGEDGWGRFLTGLRVVATASSDAVSSAAGIARLFTSEDARAAFGESVGTFLKDPVGNVSRAFNDWADKAWH